MENNKIVFLVKTIGERKNDKAILGLLFVVIAFIFVALLVDVYLFWYYFGKQKKIVDNNANTKTLVYSSPTTIGSPVLNNFNTKKVGEICQGCKVISYGSISPDGRHFGYVVEKGDKEFVVVDGKKGKEYDYIENQDYPADASLPIPLFSPDNNHWAYTAKENGE